ncbi:MAG: histidine kinase [Epsilonproteobacteria bacterium]|nr:histidine kinase [Campylobacterota bacterium]
MESVELKIAQKDWVYITIIGVMFGFLLSLLIYFLNPALQAPSTIFFSIFTGFFIAFFAGLFITISNNFILPKVNRRFWYLISFFFSFLSGCFGFLLSYALFLTIQAPIAIYLSPFIFYIAVIVGLMTFLVGLMLHHFIAMKYRHESYKNAMTELRLKSLETELNPHFIFNALNSISELIHVDKNLAEDALMKLSQLLRSAITQKSLITVEEELLMVEHYLMLENIRFDDNIHFEKQLHEAHLKLKVPKFSIQLLVENSIKHGFKNTPLHIALYVDNHALLICNNGKKAEKIIYGTGLKNLQRRLEILQVGTLRYEKNENICFKIIWRGLS